MSRAPGLPGGMPDEIIVAQLLLGGQQLQIGQTRRMRMDLGPQCIPHRRIKWRQRRGMIETDFSTSSHDRTLDMNFLEMAAVRSS